MTLGTLTERVLRLDVISGESEFEGRSGPISHTYNEIYTDVLEPTISTLNLLGIKTNRAPVCCLLTTTISVFSYYF